MDQNGNPTSPAGRTPGPNDTAILQERASLGELNTTVQALRVNPGGELIGGGVLTVTNLDMKSTSAAASLGDVTVRVAGAMTVTGTLNRLTATTLVIGEGATATLTPGSFLQCASGIVTPATIKNFGTFVLMDKAELTAGQDFVSSSGLFTFQNAVNPDGTSGTLVANGATFIININNTQLVLDNNGIIRCDSGLLTLRGLLKGGGTNGNYGRLVTSVSSAQISASCNIDAGSFIEIMGDGTTFMPGLPGLGNGSTSFEVNGVLKVGLLGTAGLGELGHLVITSDFKTADRGIIAVSPGSKLTLDQATMTGGQITADQFATLLFRGAKMSGGMIRNSGDATFTVPAGTSGASLEMGGSATFVNTSYGLIKIDTDQLISATSATASIKNNGVLRKSGGTGTTFIQPRVSNSSYVEVDSGNLEFDGPFVQYEGLILLEGNIIAPLGLDIIAGFIQGKGTVTGDVRHFGGALAPGKSPGAITITGNYFMGANAFLNMDIGGAAPGTGFDQLAVSGKATLNGTLNISLMQGFHPNPGDTFALLTSGSESGSFATTNAPGGVSAQIGPNGVTFVEPPLPASLPVITSPTTGSGALGQSFTYTVTATQSPAGFAATGLPSGLTLDGSNGVISGTPTIAGTFTVQLFATNSSGTGSAFLSLDVANTSDRNPLLNISTRLSVGTGNGVLIAGFIVTGAEAKKIIIRAIGPSLSIGGVPVTGRLPDPTLELHDSTGGIIATNDNWKTTVLGGIITADQVADIQATTIAPTNDFESAIIATLAPGNYTAVIRGINNATGIGLAEVYDLSQDAVADLGNISTRGFVDTNDNVMIGGFIVGNHLTTVLVRAIGPSLSTFGIANFLADPTLELHDGSGNLIATNDNWRSTQEGEIIATTLAPSQDKESAILRTLQPGAYTAIVRGLNNSTGVGLMEVYDLQ